MKSQITTHKPKFLLVTFLTLLSLNITRLVCQKLCLSMKWYQVILNDNLHHYQLGLVLIPISLLLLDRHQKLQLVVLAISLGMIIDESMYLIYPLNNNFRHNTLTGTIFEFTVFLLLATFLKLKPSSR
jgi:hypothetical protein